MKQDKKKIVFIDHLSRIKYDVEELEGKACDNDGTTTRLSDEYNFVAKVTSDPDMVDGHFVNDRVIQEIKKIIDSEKPDLVSVDISFGSAKEDHSNGIFIGRELQEYYPEIAIALHTKQGSRINEKMAEYSTYGFAIVIPSFGFGGDTIKEWLKKAFDNFERDIIRLPYFMRQDSKVVHWRNGHPLTRSNQIKHAAPILAEKFFRFMGIDDAQATLSEMSGGFSGSFLIRAETESKTFILKIDENPERLKNELDGYKKINQKVDDDYFFDPHDKACIELMNGLWGVIGLKFIANAVPLIEHKGNLDGIYRSVWEDALKNLYGKITNEPLEIKEIICDKLLEHARQNLSSLSRYSQGQHIKVNIDSLGEVLSGQSLELLHAENIHGDLNCRNIMYRDEHNPIKLIDFPNVKPGPLCQDFVKAEAELVVIMMDWHTGMDCDFIRLDAWMEMLKPFSNTFEPLEEVGICGDGELSRIASAIKVIRSKYKDMVGDNTKDAFDAYRVFVIAQLLNYTGYSDVTIAKRFLSYRWAIALAEAQWGTP